MSTMDTNTTHKQYKHTKMEN